MPKPNNKRTAIKIMEDVFVDLLDDLSMEAEYTSTHVTAGIMEASGQMGDHFMAYVAPAFGYHDRMEGEPKDNKNLATMFYCMCVLATCGGVLRELIANEEEKT